VCLEESKNDDLICVCKSDFLFSSPFLNHSPTRLFCFPSKTTERKTRRNNVMDRPAIVCLCVRPTEYSWKKRPKIDRSRQQFSSSDGCYNLRGVRYYILHKTEFLFGLETIITNHKKRAPQPPFFGEYKRKSIDRPIHPRHLAISLPTFWLSSSIGRWWHLSAQEINQFHRS
jgi:hypothetical protein